MRQPWWALCRTPSGVSLDEFDFVVDDDPARVACACSWLAGRAAVSGRATIVLDDCVHEYRASARGCFVV